MVTKRYCYKNYLNNVGKNLYWLNTTLADYFGIKQQKIYFKNSKSKSTSNKKLAIYFRRLRTVKIK